MHRAGYFKRIGRDDLVIGAVGYAVVGLVALFCFFPFYIMIINSVQSETSVLRYGYALLPTMFDLAAYRFLFTNTKQLLMSYEITIALTLVGTTLGVLLTTMTGYVLSRTCVKYRRPMTFFLFFTTLFNGGLMSSYIITSNVYHLKNTFWVLLVANLVGVMYILISRTYIRNSIPESVIEAAKVDGYGEFFIYLRIILPMLTPLVATLSLFIALGYWNNWSTAMLYVTKQELFPLQYLLYRMIASATYIQQLLKTGGNVVATNNLPQETVKLAMTIVATGPIILAYPFAQRYLINGITIGAVKE